MAYKIIGNGIKGRPDNECKIQIGTGAGSKHFHLPKTLDGFFEDVNGGYFFCKQDLINYLEDSKEEFLHPSEKYHFYQEAPLDMPKYWNELMREVTTLDDYLYLKFEKGMVNDKSGRPYYHLSDDLSRQRYDILYKMCIPTKNARNGQYRSIYKLVKILDTQTNKKYIHIIPIFNMAYSIEQLSGFLKRDYPVEIEKQKSFMFDFFFRYANFIKSQKYSLKEIVEKAGLEVPYLDELEAAISSFSNNFSNVKNVYQLFANSERVYDDANHTMKSLYESLQQIFYGAPGTGKSHSIKEKTKDEEVIRTTFHPDSDYSTFVGAYKPTMVEEDAKVVPVVINNGISLDQNKGTYKEKRISYQFVKQAFLKAYLGAWKKYSMGLSSSPVSGITVSSGNEIWSLERIVDDKVFYLKSSILELEKYGDLVQKCWASIQESDDPDNYLPGTTERYQASACVWYKEKNSLEHTPEECWDAVKNELTNGGTILSTPGKYQSYSISLNGKDQIKISSRATAWKTTIYKNFHAPEEHGNSVQKAIARKLADYGEGDFDKLWNRLKEEVNQRQNSARNSSMNSVKPQFLIIEEINRGNCAQIFGDLFQLLDRSDNGFSTYPIDADTDIMNEINKAFKEEVEYKLDYDLNIEGVIEDYTSNYGASLSEDVQTGRVLLLPPNLYIWATMNTSDQSLFPIDSAFKRRWDWVYMPIGYKNNNWAIEIGEKKYNWVDFQHKINESIYAIDNSEDKQLGDYFVNADRTDFKISADTLLNKILFYIWNDVCKDDPDQIFRWKDDDQEKSIKFSDFFGADRDKKLQGFMSFHKVSVIGETTNADNSEDIQDEVTDTDESPSEDDNDVNA